jgi:hypothetical protein
VGLSVYGKTDIEGKWLGGVLDDLHSAWNELVGHRDMVAHCFVYHERHKT